VQLDAYETIVSKPPLPEGTKYEILKLLAKQELSAQSLAETLGVSAAAVRQHLETLNALSLVSRRKVVTKPSRPTFLYRLSRRGVETFPKRYDLLLGLITDAIRERGGGDAVADIVETGAERLAAQLHGMFDTPDARRRWDVLTEWFDRELAWHADVSSEPTGVRRVRIHQCPFQAVSRRKQPSVCGVFFRTLIRRLYDRVPVEHVLLTDGVACCELLVGDKIA
jgi:predicted ArsR family transcriptional regulator